MYRSLKRCGTQRVPGTGSSMTFRVYNHPNTDGMQRFAEAMQFMLDGAYTP
jgi:hypothetical protein